MQNIDTILEQAMALPYETRLDLIKIIKKLSTHKLSGNLKGYYSASGSSKYCMDLNHD